MLTSHGEFGSELREVDQCACQLFNSQKGEEFKLCLSHHDFLWAFCSSLVSVSAFAEHTITKPDFFCVVAVPSDFVIPTGKANQVRVCQAGIMRAKVPLPLQSLRGIEYKIAFC